MEGIERLQNEVNNLKDANESAKSVSEKIRSDTEWLKVEMKKLKHRTHITDAEYVYGKEVDDKY